MCLFQRNFHLHWKQFVILQSNGIALMENWQFLHMEQGTGDVPFPLGFNQSGSWDGGGCSKQLCLDSRVHGANMGPIWVLSVPDGPRVGLMNLAIWVILKINQSLLTHNGCIYREVQVNSSAW